jgi:phosphoribosylformylglycinamidine cyclo-ligase
MKIDYKSAGVNIDAGNEAVERIKIHVSKTFGPEVLTGIGSFGAFFDLSEVLKRFNQPVLVQSVDGVGTKIIIARMAGKFNTIGHDLVSACCNDIIVHGAHPLTFLDYIANDRLQPVIIEEIIKGMAEACAANSVALIGGETAEMPDTYLPNEHDLVGIVTGVVEKDQVINGANIMPGDQIFGVASSGLHTNGYSLARKLFFKVGHYQINSYIKECNDSLGAVLLTPHYNYTQPVLKMLQDQIAIKGMAHITGGGLLENIPRILPPKTAVEIRRRSWTIPPIFNLMQKLGEIKDQEMFRTFNMGIGLVIVISRNQSIKTEQLTEYFQLPVWPIGNIVPGNQKVYLIR